jgi:hypothetical protein
MAGAREQTQTGKTNSHLGTATKHFERFLESFIDELPERVHALLRAEKPHGTGEHGAYKLDDLPKCVVGCKIPIEGRVEDSNILDKFMGYLFTVDSVKSKNTALNYFSAISNRLRDQHPDLHAFFVNESRKAVVCAGTHYTRKAADTDDVVTHHHIPLRNEEQCRLTKGMFMNQMHEECALQAFDRDVGGRVTAVSRDKVSQLEIYYQTAKQNNAREERSNLRLRHNDGKTDVRYGCLSCRLRSKEAPCRLPT